jgi:hypothetical protein
MKIRLCGTVAGVRGRAGDVVDVDKETAEHAFRIGAAVPVTMKKKRTTKKKDPAKEERGA